jgi:hypothetical protein
VHRSSLYMGLNWSEQIPNLGHFKRTWETIELHTTKDPDDKYRCVYFIKLITAYADALLQKFQLLKDFGSVIESGAYSLKMQSFQRQPGERGNSPLNVHLMTSLLGIWRLMHQVASKLLTKPLHLWPLRLQIYLNLIEEEFLLASLTVHLIVTFKSVYASQ